MPKATVSVGAGKRPKKVTRKFAIKGRKSAVSAHSLSTDELQTIATKGGKNAYMAVQVLAKRGIAVAAPEVVEEAA